MKALLARTVLALCLLMLPLQAGAAIGTPMPPGPSQPGYAAQAPQPMPMQQAPAQVAMPSASTGAQDYVLGVGDKLRITTFGEADLSGEFEISSTGMVSMPLIGEVKAAGLTISQLKSTLTSKLADGYMKDPKVSMEVMNYRPFFIVGEVMKPGSYNYVNGMTVINAVALAGGYTYRADKSEITVKRGGMNGPQEKAGEDAPVAPGDVVNVPERFF